MFLIYVITKRKHLRYDENDISSLLNTSWKQNSKDVPGGKKILSKCTGVRNERQNVLIVPDCLFNQNSLCVCHPARSSLSKSGGGNGQQCLFLKTVQLSKSQWHIHNAHLISSWLPQGPTFPLYWSPKQAVWLAACLCYCWKFALPLISAAVVSQVKIKFKCNGQLLI